MSVPVTGALEPFIRASGFDYWNRFAAVNDEFIPIHMDDEAGRKAGYPAAFGMGTLTWSYVHLALHQWFGDRATIRKVDISFRNAVVRGNTVKVEGQISGTREVEGRTEYQVEILISNQDGLTIAPAKATVFA